MKYPETVSILGPHNFVRGTMANAKGQHCINGWIAAEFLGDGGMTVDAVGTKARPVVRAMLWASRKLGLKVRPAAEAGSPAGLAWQLVDINDERINVSKNSDECTWKNVNSATLLARVWNLGIAKLGYVVGNPEAKTLKKLTA